MALGEIRNNNEEQIVAGKLIGAHLADVSIA
jgi:hypothetical protein